MNAFIPTRNATQKNRYFIMQTFFAQGKKLLPILIGVFTKTSLSQKKKTILDYNSIIKWTNSSTSTQRLLKLFNNKQ